MAETDHSSFFDFEPVLDKKSSKKSTPKKPEIKNTKRVYEKPIPIIQSENFFISDSIATDRRKTENLIPVPNPIMYSDPDPQLYIIMTCSHLIPKVMERFVSWVRDVLRVGGHPYLPFALVYAFTHDLDDVLDDSSITSQLGIDWKDYFDPGSKFVTMASSAIRAITKNQDLNVESFYDTVFNQPYFYAPMAQGWVFPTNKFNQIWWAETNEPNETFDREFFKSQLISAANFEIPSKIFPDPILIDVEDPNTFLEEHMEPKAVCWDLETSGFHFMMNRVVCLTLTFDGITGYFLRWNKIDLKILNRFFENKFQIGANLKFDCKFARHRGVSNAKIDFDTYNAGHVLNEMRNNGLKAHAFLFTPWGGYDDDLENYKDKYKFANDDYSLIPIPILRPYATMDVIVCFRVYEKMVEQLAADSFVARYYYEEVIPSLEMYLESELRGLDVDWDSVRLIGTEVLEQIEQARLKIYQVLGKKIDLDSGTELALHIEHKLKWPVIERTKAGHYKIGKIPMNEWKKLGYKEAGLFLEFGQLRSTYNSFIGDEKEGKGLWQYLTPTGRIYPTFSVMLAKSGRNRSSGPNFQNFPIKSLLGKKIRQFFKSWVDEECLSKKNWLYASALVNNEIVYFKQGYLIPEGATYYIKNKTSYLFGETDSAGLQLRIGAAQSGDTVMRDIFANSDGDMHSASAHTVFCKRYPVFPINCCDFDGVMTSIHPALVEREGAEESIALFQLRRTDKLKSVLKSDGSKIEFPTPLTGLSFTGISSHTMTLLEFKDFKSIPPYKTKRTKGKNINFGEIFGTSAVGFGLGLLHQEWTDNDCIQFIEEEHLQVGVQKFLKNGHFNLSQARYIACAEFIGNNFFELYKGLKEWQLRNIEIGKRDGFIRSPFGARRLLPELRYIGARDQRGHIKNLENITANSPVQNHEVVVMHRAMRHVRSYIKEHEMKSFIIGNVHDAATANYHRNEVNELLPVIAAGFSLDCPENNGIPFEGSTNLADPIKGEGWGFGKEIDSDNAPDYEMDFEEEAFE